VDDSRKTPRVAFALRASGMRPVTSGTRRPAAGVAQ
jgi:hypothetical protein